MAGKLSCKHPDDGIPYPPRTIYGILESLGVLDEPVQSGCEATECASCGQDLSPLPDRDDSGLPTTSPSSNQDNSNTLAASKNKGKALLTDHTTDNLRHQYSSTYRTMHRLPSLSASWMNGDRMEADIPPLGQQSGVNIKALNAQYYRQQAPLDDFAVPQIDTFNNLGNFDQHQWRSPKWITELDDFEWPDPSTAAFNLDGGLTIGAPSA